LEWNDAPPEQPIDSFYYSHHNYLDVICPGHVRDMNQAVDRFFLWILNFQILGLSKSNAELRVAFRDNVYGTSLSLTLNWSFKNQDIDKCCWYQSQNYHDTLILMNHQIKTKAFDWISIESS
jgi:hypothetical protein